jgi:hypothetical protein
MNIILDRVAVWLPQNVDGLLVRKAPPTTTYLTKDSLVYKQATQSLYRYVKNYEVGRGKDRVKFCLFALSFEKDGKVVEAELDRISAELPKEYVVKELTGATFESFAYTDYYLKGKEAR